MFNLKTHYYKYCQFVSSVSVIFFFFNFSNLNNEVTVNFLNIRTPKKFVVIALKFELCGSTIEQWMLTMQTERQTV